MGWMMGFEISFFMQRYDFFLTERLPLTMQSLRINKVSQGLYHVGNICYGPGVGVNEN